MEYDILYCGQAICLINCFLDRDKLTYGFGFFMSNTPPVVNLYDGSGNFIVKVEIPSEIVINPIMEVMGDAHETNVLMRVFDSTI